MNRLAAAASIRRPRAWTLWLAANFLLFPAAAQVRVWQDSLTLPTYEEGAPERTPPYWFFNPDNPVYPYTIRKGFSKVRADHGWRALRIENEYLSCVVLPDLGGRLYSCKDKISGREMFHANDVVKKAWVGLRGAWVAMGVEMNFPTGHTWVAISPVDFATIQNADGSASIWVGNVDRVAGMEWLVEFVLKPRSTVLQQNVTLYNRSAFRRRFYWWNNAGVTRVDDKTKFVYPTHLVATHGRTEIDTWPVNSAGVDMTVAGNHKKDGVALFAYECREPFMAVYHPTLRSGVVHYADPKAVPGKKLWSWGAQGDKWVSTELSDHGKSYVEMQAGVFENQETYEFLAPGESRHFTEYWMPARDLGGIARANLDGVLNLQRSQEAAGHISLTVEFNANHVIPAASLAVSEGSRKVWESSAGLDPAVTYRQTIPNLPAQPRYTFQLTDSAGRVLLAHTEDQYDAAQPKDVKLGPQQRPDLLLEHAKTAADFLHIGEHEELQDRTFPAREDYKAGLAQFPDDLDLVRAMGRLAVSKSRWEEAISFLTHALSIAPRDTESHYYLGIAYASSGDDPKARKELEAVAAGPFHTAANLALGELLARAQEDSAAVQRFEAVFSEQPRMTRAGVAEAALLRRAGDAAKARTLVARLRTMDPTDSSLRFEQTLLGQDDPALWPHLGADPERVLNIAIGYMRLGSYNDALSVLGRKYPAAVDVMSSEPGAVLPQHYPLVGYYRAYCLMKTGQAAGPALQDASGYFTEYVFASRPSTYPVLQYALKENPSDATAHFLLGELRLASEDVDQAVAEWQAARKLNFRRAELYRDLGRTLLVLKKDTHSALEVYQQGAKLAPGDPDLQQGLQALFGPASLPKPAAESALAPPAPVVGGPPAPKATDAPRSPEGWATFALGLAAEGRLQEALAVFEPANFPEEKQDALVREAYIQVQVQAILALARKRDCDQAFAGEERLGDEDPSLPFTFHSFSGIIKTLRVQYSLAMAEEVCGNEKGARKTWAKVAKTVREVNDLDFALPLVADAKISQPAEVRPRIEAALVRIQSAMTGAADRSTLLYSRGLLLRALGREKDAQGSFVEAVGTKASLVSYLALAALRDH